MSAEDCAAVQLLAPVRGPPPHKRARPSRARTVLDDAAAPRAASELGDAEETGRAATARPFLPGAEGGGWVTAVAPGGMPKQHATPAAAAPVALRCGDSGTCTSGPHENVELSELLAAGRSAHASQCSTLHVLGRMLFPLIATAQCPCNACGCGCLLVPVYEMEVCCRYA